MKGVNVPADVLAALIRVYKRAHESKLMDIEATKHYPAIHRLEYTATRKLLDAKKEKNDG